MSTELKGRHTKRRKVASTRVNLRIQPDVKALLARAANLHQLKLTQFMIQSSQAAAEITLADRTRFILPREKWNEFNLALDAAPRGIPSLRNLFSQADIFER